MSGVYTLRQLAVFGATVYAQCEWCGHFKAVEHPELESLGLDSAVEDIRLRMRCRICKRRQCRLTTDRPTRGERDCPKCGQARWKPTPMDLARNVRRCSRCGKPLIRD